MPYPGITSTLRALAAAGILCAGVGCEPKTGEPPSKEAPTEERQLTGAAFEAPATVSLLKPDGFARHALELTDTRVVPDCHEIFEPDPGAAPHAWPLTEDHSAALTLSGCRPEAHTRTESGQRYLVYALPPDAPSGPRDLRLVAYDADGTLRWQHRMDRSEQGKNFNANFRDSFIALLPPRMTCVGTLWQGGTQVACLEDDTGESVWSGMMRFWSGVPLRGLNNSLYGADINGMTRRYPFSGVEMRHRAFEGQGGRAAFYATDDAHVFFAPVADDPVMTAYTFEDMRPAWSLQLPAKPLVSYAHTFADHNLLVLHAADTLYGLDTATGKVLWAFDAGADHPPLASGPDALYLLLRREEGANLLYAIEPRTGRVQWVADTPTGTLDVGWVEDTLVLRSVRAVRAMLTHAPEPRL